MTNISIIIPTFNEALTISPLLAQLQAWRLLGDELILVDGGSSDGLQDIAAGLVDVFLDAPRGRSVQLNAGAEKASKSFLWFVHADSDVTRIDRKKFDDQLRNFIVWGFFNVRISDSSFIFRVIERFMNIRSRATSVATGDQGIFVGRDLFFESGCYKDICLMEDVELSKVLRARLQPSDPESVILTSSRRWRTKGVLRTIFFMWFLRFAWILGVPSKFLQRMYDK